MDVFWLVTLFHFRPTSTQWSLVEDHAINNFEAMGIEEFALNEGEVDEILGQRSYSGGDLPIEVLNEVEDRVLNNPINYRFFFSSELNAQHFQQFLQSQFLCETQIEKKETEDWNAEWKKHFAPILINESLEILPSWTNNHSSPAKKQLYIYPGMGFGTGSHETTFLCLKLFTENLLHKNISSVLDFGSGSGILGLSVFNFFPSAEIDFYDIDPEANKNCYHNAEINHLENKSFRLLLPEVRNHLKEKYDLVFANILENILFFEKESLVNYLRPGGSLILSGLLRHQAPGIIQAYQDKGLVLKLKLEKGDWVALLFEKGQE